MLEHDWRCPIEQAQRLFVALKLQGVPAEMLIFLPKARLSRAGGPGHAWLASRRSSVVVPSLVVAADVGYLNMLRNPVQRHRSRIATASGRTAPGPHQIGDNRRPIKAIVRSMGSRQFQNAVHPRSRHRARPWGMRPTSRASARAFRDDVAAATVPYRR